MHVSWYGMAIEDYYNTLASVNKFGEGTAPDYEQSFSLQDEFYGLLDKSKSTRTWTERGSVVQIDSKFFCDADTDITEKDRLLIIEDHIIAVADVGGYHKETGGAWTLTASAAIGGTCIFYQASDSSGTGRKADGDEYTVYSKKNPNMMGRHLELFLQKVGE